MDFNTDGKVDQQDFLSLGKFLLRICNIGLAMKTFLRIPTDFILSPQTGAVVSVRQN